MNAQNKIEVNQSSLLSLKAELLRKKQEVHDAKLSEFPNRPTVVTKTKLKTKLDKQNEGVSDRDQKDAEQIEEERNVLHKSHMALEAKSKLYDELVNNPNSGVDRSNFLVDFKRKTEEIPQTSATGTVQPVVDKPDEEEEEEDKIESDYEDDDEEWVDFVDCLGRTKRCHRDDLTAMKESDEKLRVSLFGSAVREGRDGAGHLGNDAGDGAGTAEGETKEPELCSDDMRREMMRQKWEEEERKLMDQKNVHYQHVLFDEARNHGVGYYNFSTDEAERLRQLEALKNLRKETVQQQAATQDAAARKKKQMEERLRAARRRKRERLGLPPEEEPEETPEPVVEEETPEEKPKETKKRERPTPTIRPWDIGKEKVPRVLTQDEWVAKKREERPEEFAPPVSFGRYDRKSRKADDVRDVPEAYLEDVRGSRRRETAVRCAKDSSDDDEEDDRRGRRAEVPPPPTFEMYGPTSKRPRPSSSQTEIEKSIEEGLNFIRRQVEERQGKKDKGFVDIC